MILNLAPYAAPPTCRLSSAAELAHMLLSLSYSASSAGHRVMGALCPPTPYQRCTALLAFYDCIFGVLLPLMLLVPLRQVERGGGGGSRARGPRVRGWRDRADGCIEACLRPLMWPTLRGTRSRQDREGRDHRQDNAAAGDDDFMGPPAPKVLLLRWYLLLMVLWTVCCLLS